MLSSEAAPHLWQAGVGGNSEAAQAGLGWKNIVYDGEAMVHQLRREATGGQPGPYKGPADGGPFGLHFRRWQSGGLFSIKMAGGDSIDMGQRHRGDGKNLGHVDGQVPL
jgi:hypothetical protein